MMILLPGVAGVARQRPVRACVGQCRRLPSARPINCASDKLTHVRNETRRAPHNPLRARYGARLRCVCVCAFVCVAAACGGGSFILTHFSEHKQTRARSLALAGVAVATQSHTPALALTIRGGEKYTRARTVPIYRLYCVFVRVCVCESYTTFQLRSYGLVAVYTHSIIFMRVHRHLLLWFAAGTHTFGEVCACE